MFQKKIFSNIKILRKNLAKFKIRGNKLGNKNKQEKCKLTIKLLKMNILNQRLKKILSQQLKRMKLNK